MSVDSTRAPSDSTAVGDRSAWLEVTTRSARPMDDVGGEFDGWLIVLQELRDLADAPASLKRFELRLQSDPDNLEIVTGEIEGRPVVLLVLGRFDSRSEAEAAAAEQGFRIPPTAWFLHVQALE